MQGGPAVRRRITDAWARLGALTPAAGLAAMNMRRSGGAAPAPDWDADAAEEPSSNRSDAPAKPSSNRNKLLVAGAGVLAVVAVGGVLIAPRLLGPSDPGCKAYAGTAVTAYNKTIDDLNAQASQSVLSADMSTTVTDLNSAIAQAQSASVKSALNGLLTQVETVKADVKAGSVPSTTVSALNAASTAADNAC
jgi:hypothetical protein